MIRKHPSELLQQTILEAYEKRFRFDWPQTVPSFQRRLVSIEHFLPEDTFTTLRNAAERRLQGDRVHIPIHKRGKTISYHDLHYRAPEFVAFYRSPELHEWCSRIVGDPVVPTPLSDLSSCSLLIYDRAQDHIRWHYDINFYRGRHFTALLSLVNSNAGCSGLSSAELMVRDQANELHIPTPPNTLVLFEGARIYHSVTRLGRGERRIILSMTFCTTPAASTMQTLERRFKDIAYFGLRALWT